MKKISSCRTVNGTVFSLIVWSVFIAICIFLDIYNAYKLTKKILHLENRTFR